MSFRIAVGGIHTECSTSSPVLMQPEDFRVLRGPDLLAHEYFDFLDAEGVEHLPLLHARAVPVVRWRAPPMKGSRRSSSSG